VRERSDFFNGDAPDKATPLLFLVWALVAAGR
jgi:hypothetical protein